MQKMVQREPVVDVHSTLSRAKLAVTHSCSFIDSFGGLCYPPKMGRKDGVGELFQDVKSPWSHMTQSSFVPGDVVRRQGWGLFLVGLSLFGSALLCFPVGGQAAETHSKVKPASVPRPEPEFRIVDLDVTPTPYEPGNGPLQFSVTVQLPRELDGAVILEVTSLISSPSKTSLRFLSHRQPIERLLPRHGENERPRVSIDLSWDGQDHRKQLAAAGTYSYEVRTKLLASGEKGPRTMMVAWPKRGTLDVR